MSGIIFFRVTLIFYSIMVLPSSGLTVLNNLLSEGTNTSARMEEFTQKGRSISPLFNIEQRWLIYWPFIPSITKMYITCILHVLCKWPLRAWQTCWKQVACQTGGWKPPLLVLWLSSNNLPASSLFFEHKCLWSFPVIFFPGICTMTLLFLAL